MQTCILLPSLIFIYLFYFSNLYLWLEAQGLGLTSDFALLQEMRIKLLTCYALDVNQDG